LVLGRVLIEAGVALADERWMGARKTVLFRHDGGGGVTSPATSATRPLGVTLAPRTPT